MYVEAFESWPHCLMKGMTRATRARCTNPRGYGDRYRYRPAGPGISIWILEFPEIAEPNTVFTK